eukprot:Rhum_TRINITY_DN14024_c0_g1::Rhum_TRINITY_DN14024_c0_g1_i2::g.67642::m.67642
MSARACRPRWVSAAGFAVFLAACTIVDAFVDYKPNVPVNVFSGTIPPCEAYAFKQGCSCDTPLGESTVYVDVGFIPGAGVELRCDVCRSLNLDAAYSILTGRLRITGDATIGVHRTALANVSFVSPDILRARKSGYKVRYNYGPLYIESVDRHYSFGPCGGSDGLTWGDAQAYCADRSRDVLGLVGYLPTHTSTPENVLHRLATDACVAGLGCAWFLGAAWRNATPDASYWRWVTGSAGTLGSLGCQPYTAAYGPHRSACDLTLNADGCSGAECQKGGPPLEGRQYQNWSVYIPPATAFSKWDAVAAYDAESMDSGRWVVMNATERLTSCACEWGGVGSSCFRSPEDLSGYMEIVARPAPPALYVRGSKTTPWAHVSCSKMIAGFSAGCSCDMPLSAAWVGIASPHLILSSEYQFWCPLCEELGLTAMVNVGVIHIGGYHAHVSITGDGTLTTYAKVISTFVFSTTTGRSNTLRLSFGFGHPLWNMQSGHFYSFEQGNWSWAQAQEHCNGYDFFGLKGYAATITSAEEDNAMFSMFVGTMLSNYADGYIGAVPSKTNMWRWMTGPEGVAGGCVYEPSRTSCAASPVATPARCKGLDCEKGLLFFREGFGFDAPRRYGYSNLPIDAVTSSKSPGLSWSLSAWDDNPNRGVLCEWGGLGDLCIAPSDLTHVTPLRVVPQLYLNEAEDAPRAYASSTSVAWPYLPVEAKTLVGHPDLVVLAVKEDQPGLHLVRGTEEVAWLPFACTGALVLLGDKYAVSASSNGSSFDSSAADHAADSRLIVVDLSTPEDPRVVGNFSLVGRGAVSVMHVDGHKLYCATWYSTTLIIDMSDPLAPSLQARLSTNCFLPTSMAVVGNLLYISGTQLYRDSALCAVDTDTAAYYGVTELPAAAFDRTPALFSLGGVNSTDDARLAAFYVTSGATYHVIDASDPTDLNITEQVSFSRTLTYLPESATRVGDRVYLNKANIGVIIVDIHSGRLIMVLSVPHLQYPKFVTASGSTLYIFGTDSDSSPLHMHVVSLEAVSDATPSPPTIPPTPTSTPDDNQLYLAIGFGTIGFFCLICALVGCRCVVVLRKRKEKEKAKQDANTWSELADQPYPTAPPGHGQNPLWSYVPPALPPQPVPFVPAYAPPVPAPAPAPAPAYPPHALYPLPRVGVHPMPAESVTLPAPTPASAQERPSTEATPASNTAPTVSWEEITCGDRIGTGASSSVYRATWRGAVVAVKEVPHTDAVLAEVNAQSQTSHPHIVQCHGYAVNGEKLYVVMEYCEGGCLKTLLEEKRRQGTPITVEELLRIAKHVSLAMSSMHADGWVHRDIAARNIFKKDETYKLGDFGLVREVDSTGSYKLKGPERIPVHWTSPEALRRHIFSKPGDVWSFGVLLWEVLVYCSQRPYNNKMGLAQIEKRIVAGETLSRPDGCPPMLWDSLVARCFFAPEDRPPFAKIAEEIIPALIAAGSDVSPVGAIEINSPYRDPDGDMYGPCAPLCLRDPIPIDPVTNAPALAE